VCPSEFRTHQPDGSDRSVDEWTGFSTDVLSNRYKNAALFLESELMHFIGSLDLKKNILIITGDHGESMGEDGFRSHTGPASEVQTHVPFIMLGAGVRPGRIRTATSHTDILPTLLHQIAGKHVPIRHCHGRDLLADPHPADEALVVPLLWPALSKLVFVRGDKRILLDVKTTGNSLKSVHFAAFLDDSGMYQLRMAGVRKPVTPLPSTERADHWSGTERTYKR
jgi:membrane-anchored protein YejM (alkaline phosphatase superfamily)